MDVFHGFLRIVRDTVARLYHEMLFVVKTKATNKNIKEEKEINS